MKKTKQEIYYLCMTNSLTIYELNNAIIELDDSISIDDSYIAFEKLMNLWEKLDPNLIPWADGRWQDYYKECLIINDIIDIFNDQIVRFIEDEDELYSNDELPIYKD